MSRLSDTIALLVVLALVAIGLMWPSKPKAPTVMREAKSNSCALAASPVSIKRHTFN